MVDFVVDLGVDFGVDLGVDLWVDFGVNFDVDFIVHDRDEFCDGFRVDFMLIFLAAFTTAVSDTHGTHPKNPRSSNDAPHGPLRPVVCAGGGPARCLSRRKNAVGKKVSTPGSSSRLRSAKHRGSRRALPFPAAP